MPTGEVREIFRNETEVRFEWRIWKIFSMPEKIGILFDSALVQFSTTWWYLEIFPHGVSLVSKEWIGIGVVKIDVTSSGRFTLGIRRAGGAEEKIVHDQSVPENRGAYTVKNFLRRSDLLSRKSELAPFDVLTVICTIRRDEPLPAGEKKIFHFPFNTDSPRSTRTRKKKFAPLDTKGKTLVSRESQTEDESKTSTRGAELADLDAKGKTLVCRETQTEDESNTGTRGAEHTDLDAKGVCILRQQLKDLLLDGNAHDVTFKVKDREFRAHRDMLRARSPVFAAMFRHEMKEFTSDDPIDIVDCSPETFGEFLQYVYTGKVENFSPSTALGLYYAGDKYDVSGLKEVCVEYLKGSLSTTAICDVIALAARYGEEELYERAMAFFLGIFGRNHEYKRVATIHGDEPFSSQ